MDVRLTWRARLDEHLGHFVVEGLKLRAAELMVAAHAAYGVTHLAAPVPAAPRAGSAR
jgi:DNA repair protein RecO (recombination protein O)